MTKKRWRILVGILLLGSILAAIKVIFFDYTLDEEYQLMMGYRTLSGDHLFKEMWEPHQTSAFLCTGLMWLYKTVTGTYTGILIYLRVCITLIQVLLSFYVYKILHKVIKKEYAFLCGILYFNMVPKIIQIPEFSNMQLWFFTLMVLSLVQYYMQPEEVQKRRWYLVVMAGVAMALEVLSYPSCLLLFPFFLVYIFVNSKKYKWRDSLLFAGTCGLCAALWLGMILTHVEWSEFVRNVDYVLGFDLTHEISGATAGKGEGIVRNILGGFGFLAVISGVSSLAWLFLRKKDKEESAKKTFLPVLVIAVLVAELIQIVYWAVLKAGYEVYQLHLLVVLLAGAVAWWYAGEGKKHLLAGIVGTWISYVAVVYISDLEMFYALPHGVLGVIFCAVVLVLALEKKMGKAAGKWVYLLLISLCLVSIFGKGYTLRGGRDYNVVIDTRGIMKTGPAVGVLSDYMNCYIYNCNYEDFRTYVDGDDTVLIVANMVFSESTTPYMITGAEVAHYSIVDPTAYDERLLTYWELYPKKEPDVIVVDCWYGQLQESPDSWIMQYIENEFGYTQVNDGRYVRFYRR